MKGTITIGSIVVILTAIISLSVVAYRNNENSALMEMVASGANPMDAQCALNGNNGIACAIRAAVHVDEKSSPSVPEVTNNKPTL